MKKHERMIEQIDQHGRNLLQAFPKATEREPVKLCKRLHRLEAEASRVTLAVCNGDITQADADVLMVPILAKICALLGDGPRVWVNWDPRGYALKVNGDDTLALHKRSVYLYRDLGGDGILAPEFNGN